MEWQQWLTFIQDRWLFLLIAAVVLFLVIGLIRTLLKWFIVVVIIAAVLLYGANYTDELRAFGDRIVEYSKDEALQLMEAELEQAEFDLSRDGTFTITTPNFTMTGASGEDEVAITYRSQTVRVKRSDFVDRIIMQARETSEN